MYKKVIVQIYLQKKWGNFSPHSLTIKQMNISILEQVEINLFIFGRFYIAYRD